MRNRRTLGLKFRRQHVLHGFIVDFYCSNLKLIVELDGDPHDNPRRAAYDAARTGWLQGAGYHVIRIKNRDLTQKNLEESIKNFLATTHE